MYCQNLGVCQPLANRSFHCLICDSATARGTEGNGGHVGEIFQREEYEGAEF